MHRCCATSRAVSGRPGRYVLLVLVFVLCSSLLAWAQQADQMSGPITIISDRMESFDSGAVIIFSGNVKAFQGDVTVDADKLRISYRSGSRSDDEPAGNGIEQIQAEGAVVIMSERGVMTGDYAIFEYDQQTIVVTGDRARLEDGDNIVEGGRITWNMAEGRGMVDDLKGGRVTATIQSETR